MLARPDETVRDARDRYLDDNGLTTELYTQRWVPFPIGPWRFKHYNPRQRRWAIARHDLHHVATGYSTELVGEMEISAWEVGAGLGSLWIAYAICWPLFLAGLVKDRTRTLAAYRCGRTCRSLFARLDAYDDWIDWTVGELRRSIGLPSEGVVTARA